MSHLIVDYQCPLGTVSVDHFEINCLLRRGLSSDTWNSADIRDLPFHVLTDWIAHFDSFTPYRDGVDTSHVCVGYVSASLSKSNCCNPRSIDKHRGKAKNCSVRD